MKRPTAERTSAGKRSGRTAKIRRAKTKGEAKKNPPSGRSGGGEARTTKATKKKTQKSKTATKNAAKKKSATNKATAKKESTAKAGTRRQATKEERLVAACCPMAAERKAGGGGAALLIAVQAVRGRWITRLGRAEVMQSPGDSAIRRRTTAVRRLATMTKCGRAASILAAAASPHRLAILATLLEGPATYQALIKATGLKVGPLYHHINQLRLAALVAPRQRDLYRLTYAGQTVLLTALALLPVTRDTRPVEA